MPFDDPVARFPLLNESGARTLRWLTEHPAAPRFTHRATERLSESALGRIAAWEKGLDDAPEQGESRTSGP